MQMDGVLVHTKNDVEALWAMEKALTNGTSSAVICWISTLDQRDLRRLQLVNKSACAKGIILQSSPSTSSVTMASSIANSSFH